MGASGSDDVRGEMRQSLTTRRAPLTPERTGLPNYGGRGPPGLRGDEVALLAGISFEQGPGGGTVGGPDSSPYRRPDGARMVAGFGAETAARTAASTIVTARRRLSPR